MQTTKISLFKGKQIRKTIHNDEWWFVVEDIVLALIDSSDPKQYIQRMKNCVIRNLPKGGYKLYIPLNVKEGVFDILTYGEPV